MAYNQETNTIIDPNSGFAYTPNATGVANYNSTAPTSTAISLDQLQTATPINVPQPTPPINPLPAAAANADSTSKTLQDYIAANTPAPTALDQQQQSLIDSISQLTGLDTGRGAAQLQAEQAAGIPDQRVKLAQINADIQNRVAAANKSTASYEQLVAQLTNPNNPQQQGVVMNSITGAEREIRKLQMADQTLQAAQLSTLVAYANGLQGNLQAAQENVNRSIDLRFQDIESQLSAKLSQLQAIQPLLDKQEKIQAIALQQKYEADQQKIADEKAKAKNNLSLAVQQGVRTPYANIGGEVFNTQTGQGWSSEADFKRDTGMTVDQAYSQGKITDISYQRIQETGIIQNMINQYPDAGITLNDSLESAQSKLGKSRIYQDSVRGPVGGGGGGGGGGGSIGNYVVSPDVDARVKEIIAANPGEYGHAADQIDAEFGKGAATAYDNWLQRVYNYGQNVSDLGSTKTPTDTQNVSAGYANRLIQSNQVINQLQDSIAKYNYAGYKSQQALPSSFQSSVIQQQNQAELNFVNAVLRKESGAAISQSEYDNASKQYFPRPGDTAATLKQKAQNRQAAIQTLSRSAGSAFQVPTSTQTAASQPTSNQSQQSTNFLQKVGNWLWGSN